MIYIVTGLHRTGTSMMMRCLALSSNIPVLKDDQYEAKIRGNQKTTTFDPNPNGYWVVDPAKTKPHQPKGKLFKYDPWHLRDLPKGDYKIIFMTRNIDEAQASFRLAFGATMKDYIVEQAAQLQDQLAQRADVNLTIIDYSDVIVDPLGAFNKLLHNGWAIDPAQAASLVDPDLYRTRAQ